MPSPSPSADTASPPPETKTRLEAHLQLFSALFDRLPVAVYLLAREPEGWRLEFISQGLARLSGFDPEAVRGRLFDELLADRTVKALPGVVGAGEPDTCLRLFRTRYQGPKIFLDRRLDHGDIGANFKIGVLMEPSLDPGLDFLEYQPAALKRQAFGRPPVSKKAPASSGPAQAARPEPLHRHQYEGLGEMIGRSPQIKKVFERILKIAPTKARVLIEGESGTGKELAARALHDLSPFRDGPFIAINCGAISDNLIESEFFGHVRGAFSGATEHRRGYLDVVEGGTLFLDEIGEMPLSMQVKLLRVLDGYGHMAVGSTESKVSRFRLTCATNRSLEEEVRSGRMRYDFYHRLRQLTVTMPPLRERQGDVEYLMQVFAELYLNENHPLKLWSRPSFPPQAKARFLNYDWPGNVRELHYQVLKYLSLHEIDLAHHNADSPPEGKEYLAPPAAAPLPPAAAPRSFYEFDRDTLIAVLEGCGWNTRRAAQALGKSLRTVQRKIARYNLKTGDQL